MMNNNSLKVVDENEWINILEKNPVPVVNKNENNNEKLDEIVNNILNNVHNSIKQDENKKEVELFTDLDENYHIEKSEKNDNNDNDNDNGIIKNVFIDAMKFVSIAAGCKFIIEFIEWSG